MMEKETVKQMTARDYLQQAWYLDKRIKSDQAELEDLRRIAQNIQAHGYSEHINNPSVSTEAPFISTLERVIEFQKKISEDINLSMDLKAQIRDTLNTLKDPNERQIMQFRYIEHMKWEQIEREMGVIERTLLRWHKSALRHVILPEHPIRI